MKTKKKCLNSNVFHYRKRIKVISIKVNVHVVCVKSLLCIIQISQWTQVIVQLLSCIRFPGSYIFHNVPQLSNVY